MSLAADSVPISKEPSSASASTSHSELDQSSKLPGSKTGRLKLRWLLAGGSAFVIVLALALGLGIGLGLRNYRSNGNASLLSGNSVTANYNGKPLPFIPRRQLVDPSQFVLDASFDRHAPPTVRTYNWTISRVLSDPAGVQKPMLTVNQMSPGPTIEANLGDTILVYVKNELGNATTSIHWHGALQNGTNFMDGTIGVSECGIAPGETKLYNWTAQNQMTSWWHAHAAGQYTDGIFGALVLHSPNETYSFKHAGSVSSSGSGVTGASLATKNSTYDGDIIVIVNDIYHSISAQWIATYFQPGNADGTFEGAEPVPDSGLVAGYGRGTCLGLPPGTPCDGGQYANFTFEPNKRYRLRVINTGSIATINFSIDGHVMTLIEADGTEVQPQKITDVDVMVAQRYSVLIDTNQPAGVFYMRGKLTDDMLSYKNPALNQDQRAVMRYSNAAADATPSETLPMIPGNYSSLDASTLRPLRAINPPNPTQLTSLTVSFGISQQSDYRAFINGTSWEPEMGGNSTLLEAYNAAEVNAAFVPPISQIVAMSDSIEVLDIILSSNDEGEHPIHLHGHIPWIIGTGSGTWTPSKLDRKQTFNNPMRRDVFTVPAYGWVAVRIVTDNPGLWLFHCHIVAHMEAGFAAQFQILPSKIKQFPAMQVADGCAAVSAFSQKR
ncbi:multicopper oxidase [Tilletiaria anomala UBC 951]|uniref:Multicopper oxidase n=1 Tax=Tilletiaria anomala (strain ATCC 24038 / CBS 436.72 / UBC 951) TaxID=1037660 RepID=A0A066WPS2_TILAU|nr:multicopper oxidase [Tilletiaria anomala UBC 951]KDN52994.1 multicopper oxidase [Tilletiaria anomala UBC 951]